MTQMTVTVECTGEGRAYEMSLSTLYDPNADTAGTASTATTSSA
jgi:hypothetical protein